MNSSVQAAISQGGKAGSALAKLSSTSAIGKHRSTKINNNSTSSIHDDDDNNSVTTSPTTLTREASSGTIHNNTTNTTPNRHSITPGTSGGGFHEEEIPPDSPRIQYEDMFSPIDSDEEQEFDVVNPLYEHAGGSNSSRFRSGTIAPITWEINFSNIKSYVKRYSRVPDGRVVIEVLSGENLFSLKSDGKLDPKKLIARVRASINGASATIVSPNPGNNPKFAPNQNILDIQYYKMQNDDSDDASIKLGLKDEAEVAIEVNDASDDSFVGSASVSHVDLKFGPVAKTMKLDLVSEDGTSSAGTLEISIAYHKATWLDSWGLRGRRIVEWPKSVATSLKSYALAVPSTSKRLVEVGLGSGIGGGVGSWVVILALCVPYVLTSLFTNWSWALRQWILFIPLYGYFYICFPVIFAWVASTMITTFALHGYPGALKIGSLHVIPWIRDWHLHVRVTAMDSAFGNPPGFPLANFGQCERVDVQGRVSFRHVFDVLTLRYKKCPLKKVPDFKLLAKFDIDYVEFENVMVDFQMFEGKFNIHEFSRLLAEGEAKNRGWFKGYWKTGDPVPNELEIRIVRAKGLVKTKTSRRQQLQQAAKDASSSTWLGGARNPVVDAFLDDSKGDESDGEKEDDEVEGEASSPGNKTSSSGGGGNGNGSNAPEFYGMGPPQFNPNDDTVKARSKQGHFDPYVVIKLRRDIQKTHTQTKTNNPMWNETFYFHATDAATVVQVMVYNREVVGQDVLLGQWLMTLKWFLGDPYYCWHERGLQVTPDRWMRGWFPLINKHHRGVGKCGKIEMAMQWRYVPEDKLKRKSELPPLSAMAQMQENGDETRLRMGDMSRVKYWLDREPFLYDIRRVTVRGIQFHIQDLFRGHKGRAEAKGVEKASHVAIARLDYLSEFRPKYGDLGITTYKLIFYLFRNIAPKVLDSSTSQAGVGSAIGQIVTSAGVGMKESLGSGMKHLLKGEVSKVGVVGSITKSIHAVTKSTERAVQLLHRTVTENKTDESEFMIPVHADDEDFLVDRVDLCGHLSRCAFKAPMKNKVYNVTDSDMEAQAGTRGAFRVKYFELKGNSLFFRSNKEISKSSMFALTYKIPLNTVVGAIYFVEKDELILNQQESGFCTRLRNVTGDDAISESGNTSTTAAAGVNPLLFEWAEALKNKGVPVYTFARE
jgi:hypothetical protein